MARWEALPDCALLYAVVLAHIMLAPYTKVEESFNVQAMHDLWNHGLDLQAYDHHQFPGVVPRTFLGAMAVVLASSPALALLDLMSAPRIWQLYAVRAALGALSVASLAALRAVVARTFGRLAASVFCLLIALQFHAPFYASRPLPNVMACVLTNLAVAAWAGRAAPAQTIALLTAAMVIFRSDVALLAAPIGLHLLACRRVSLLRGVALGALAAAACLALTVGVDSLMWRRLLWPEGEVLAFNTWHNKSALWGTSPWHWYWTNALPRVLHGALPLAFLGAYLDRRVRPLLGVALTFVALYSFLPHKETRFLFPVLPLFTMAAAVAVQRIVNNARHGKTGWQVLLLGAMTALVAGVALTALTTAISSTNYPGGEAMQKLHALGPVPGHVTRVHIGPAVAMTGVSRFLQLPGQDWSYSKEEGVALVDLPAQGFDYLITDDPTSVPSCTAVAHIKGYHRIGLSRDLRGGLPLRIVTETKLRILRCGGQGEADLP